MKNLIIALVSCFVMFSLALPAQAQADAGATTPPAVPAASPTSNSGVLLDAAALKKLVTPEKCIDCDKAPAPTATTSVAVKEKKCPGGIGTYTTDAWKECSKENKKVCWDGKTYWKNQRCPPEPTDDITDRPPPPPPEPEYDDHDGVCTYGDSKEPLHYRTLRHPKAGQKKVLCDTGLYKDTPSECCPDAPGVGPIGPAGVPGVTTIIDKTKPEKPRVSVLNRGEPAEPSTKGKLVISADKPVDTPLTVPIATHGSAKGGDDYRGLLPSYTIPAGKTEVTVDIVPNDDNELEGDKTIIITIEPNDGYDAGIPATTFTLGDDEKPKVAEAPPVVTPGEPWKWPFTGNNFHRAIGFAGMAKTTLSILDFGPEGDPHQRVVRQWGNLALDLPTLKLGYVGEEWSLDWTASVAFPYLVLDVVDDDAGDPYPALSLMARSGLTWQWRIDDGNAIGPTLQATYHATHFDAFADPITSWVVSPGGLVGMSGTHRIGDSTDIGQINFVWSAMAGVEVPYMWETQAEVYHYWGIGGYVVPQLMLTAGIEWGNAGPKVVHPTGSSAAKAVPEVVHPPPQ
ncbi:hypothetical protein EPO34_04170 [Patescibacteria group bacterium]|nr:MAG: hypothetical protein EPO34_04170 [Patescibacteria group bacterium]